MIPDEELKEDNAVVYAAVSQSGEALQWAAPTLRGDREIVYKAVSQNGWALAYATEEFGSPC